jgi:sarcosine oxidase
MKTDYEYIVAGCGGIGSAALYWLSREAGAGVLGLERFRLGHDNGGSQDHSRIIRLSYHDAAYTALTAHTYAAWGEVEEESGMRLVLRTGGLDFEPPGVRPELSLERYATAMDAAGIPYERLDAAEVLRRWPQFRLEDGVRAVHQAAGGLVDARKANAAHVALARARGASVLEEAAVVGARLLDGGVEVRTARGTFTARRLVVAAGAWTNDVLRHFGRSLPITVTQEQVTYYATPQLRDFAPERFPVWIWHGEERDCFYGFPVYGEVATKAGQDVGGDVVTPETRTFEPNPRARAELRAFLERRIPGSLGPELYTKTCLYDMPPDREFVLDTLPEAPQVSVAVGAGHGFKFASLLGRILAELATRGESRHAIGKFRLDRPALTDPNYAAALMI